MVHNLRSYWEGCLSVFIMTKYQDHVPQTTFQIDWVHSSTRSPPPLLLTRSTVNLWLQIFHLENYEDIFAVKWQEMVKNSFTFIKCIKYYNLYQCLVKSLAVYKVHAKLFRLLGYCWSQELYEVQMEKQQVSFRYKYRNIYRIVINLIISPNPIGFIWFLFLLDSKIQTAFWLKLLGSYFKSSLIFAHIWRWTPYIKWQSNWERLESKKK